MSGKRDEKSQADSGFALFDPDDLQSLASAVKKANVVQQGAHELTKELADTEVEAHDEDRTIVYRCKGNQAPVSVQIQSEAIAGYSAEDLSAQILRVLLASHRCSCHHMQSKMFGLIGGSDGLDPTSQMPPVPTPIDGIVAFVRLDDAPS